MQRRCVLSLSKNPELASGARKQRFAGVVSLKRGNSFWVQKKHSDYENPNACGRM